MKKFYFDFLKWFLILHHSHSLKIVLENMSVCVCVCMFVWLLPITEPKPIVRFRSNSISRVLLLISQASFLVCTLSQKLRVVHMRKKFKILIFSKMAPTILIKFSGFIVHSKPNNMTLSAFPEKIRETRKIVFHFLSVA